MSANKLLDVDDNVANRDLTRAGSTCRWNASWVEDATPGAMCF